MDLYGMKNAISLTQVYSIQQIHIGLRQIPVPVQLIIVIDKNDSNQRKYFSNEIEI